MMAYREMAYYYDQLMQHAPYDEWVSFTQQIFHHFNKKASTITDLGCGTGEITLRLAELSYKMIGIDYSPQMLAVAEQKARAEQQTIQWMNQDLRQLAGIYDQDAIISYCDVMNYIPVLDDLKTAFQQIYHSLKDGGLFIFDVHALDYAEKYLMNHTFADVTDDFSYIWFCHAGEQSGEMFHELTFFAKNDAETYHRFTELHEQRTFNEHIYRELLAQSGFQQINVYYDFQIEPSSLKKQQERVFFVAVK